MPAHTALKLSKNVWCAAPGLIDHLLKPMRLGHESQLLVDIVVVHASDIFYGKVEFCVTRKTFGGPDNHHSFYSTGKHSCKFITGISTITEAYHDYAILRNSVDYRRSILRPLLVAEWRRTQFGFAVTTVETAITWKRCERLSINLPISTVDPSTPPWSSNNGCPLPYVS